MSEIKEHTSDLPGTKLKVTATVYDWYELEEQPGYGTTEIVADTYRIRFLGGKVRTFKPGTAFEVYVSVQQIQLSSMKHDEFVFIYDRAYSYVTPGRV